MNDPNDPKTYSSSIAFIPKKQVGSKTSLEMINYGIIDSTYFIHSDVFVCSRELDELVLCVQRRVAINCDQEASNLVPLILKPTVRMSENCRNTTVEKTTSQPVSEKTLLGK